MLKKRTSKQAKSLREEHAEATRNAILANARRCFAKQGFAATSIDQIARKARLTKGAVYYHFSDKIAVFRAVYEQLAVELASRIRHDIRNLADPQAKAFAAIDLFIECGHEVDMRNILFRDGSIVLGDDSRRIDEENFLGLIQEILTEIARGKDRKQFEVEIVSQLLLVVLIESSEILGSSTRIKDSSLVLRDVIERMVHGFAEPQERKYRSRKRSTRKSRRTGS